MCSLPGFWDAVVLFGRPIFTNLDDALEISVDKGRCGCADRLAVKHRFQLEENLDRAGG
jgi:hypothetical protein